LLSISIFYFVDEKQKEEVNVMNLKVVLLLFLMFFASAVTIALINTGVTTSHFEATSFTAKFSAFQPTGGEPIDDPTAT